MLAYDTKRRTQWAGVHPIPPAEEEADTGSVTRITVFDLDRTLTRRGTWSPFLLHAALRSAPWRLVFVPLILAAMIGHKLGFVQRRTLKQYMQRCLMGTFVDRRLAGGLASAFAERLVRKNCYVEGIARIATERASGRRVILASAANRFYLDAVAARLGISEVVGTESGWRGDFLEPRITGDNCYGTAKRDMLLAYLATQGIDPAQLDIRFYSDDCSDLPLFDIAKHPIAVNASRKLRRIAAERGWPSQTWH